MAAGRPTIGLFAGIFSYDGKLLVKRRGLDEKTYVGDWDLPGGGISEEFMSKALDERVIAQGLAERVMQEIGIDIVKYVQPMPALYPAVLVGGSDWAFALIVGIVDEIPARGELRFVSPTELLELANGPVGNRLVSGRGKRMHRMCLRMLASRDNPNYAYREEAGQMLQQIQAEWL